MTAEALPEVAAEPAGRILIVDDVPDNRAILLRRFQRRGFEIAEADSGAGALQMIAAESFDVVLLDVMMPDMNGLEVLRRIREHHSLVDLPVIMVTGKTDSEDIVEALTAGANDYITKPVDFAVAMARVSAQVGRRHAEAQVRRANDLLSRANEDLERRIAERTVELVNTNGRLTTAMEEAQAANKAKDEFLVIVSHELRTPLNGLVPMAQLLGMTTLDDSQRQMLGIVNTSAAQLNGVVTDLLDTLELSSGASQLAPAKVDLAALAREVGEVAAKAAAAKGLGFSLDIPAGLEAPVLADEKRLRQILSKLLDNAVKFTAAGEASLSLSRTAGGETVFEVRDTGVGFDEQTAARLFKAFEQADGSLVRRFGGLGLGLAICHGLVDLMGGRIEAQSRPGEGAAFRVTLPLSLAEARAAA